MDPCAAPRHHRSFSIWQWAEWASRNSRWSTEEWALYFTEWTPEEWDAWLLEWLVEGVLPRVNDYVNRNFAGNGPGGPRNGGGGAGTGGGVGTGLVDYTPLIRGR